MTANSARGFSIAVVAALFLCSLLRAQDRESEPNRDKPYSLAVDVELVELPVSVIDKDGRPVDGLQGDDFQVFEDKVQQQISLFKHEDIPLSVGLVIDNSASMRNKRERVNGAALTYARESNPDDQTFIISFDDEAYLEQDFTGSIGELVNALDNLSPRGQTALYDAVYLSAGHVVKGQHEKKVVLLISDGDDTASKYDFNKVVQALKQSRVTLYAVGLLEEGDSGGGFFRRSPGKKAKDALQEFAEVTGGHAYFPKSIDEVEDLCRRIAHEIRNQYTLGYSSSNPKRDGAWRDVSVKVNPPSKVKIAEVRSKPGYYAVAPPR